MRRAVPRRSPPSADSQSHRSWPKAARRCAATRARPQRQLGWFGRRRRTPLLRGRRWPRSVPRGWRYSLGPLHADAAARRATAAAASALRSHRARPMGGARPHPGRLAAGPPAVAALPAPRVSALDAAAWARRVMESRRWRPRGGCGGRRGRNRGRHCSGGGGGRQQLAGACVREPRWGQCWGEGRHLPLRVLDTALGRGRVTQDVTHPGAVGGRGLQLRRVGVEEARLGGADEVDDLVVAVAQWREQEEADEGVALLRVAEKLECESRARLRQRERGMRRGSCRALPGADQGQ
eukprot:scaffold41537_cov54-Phaeocystis_antarctica.AAC.1